MKIFISSVIHGMETFRNAAADGARTLRHDVRRSEDYGVSPDSPQIVCLAGVRDAEITLLLLGAAYGTVQPSGKSATHEEYEEAKALQRPVLAFVRTGLTPEPAQQQLMRDVRQWAGGQYTGSFSSPEELQALVIRALHDFQMSRAAGPVDPAEMRARAEGGIPAQSAFRSVTPRLVVAVAGGPRQVVLGPQLMEEEQFARTLQQEAMFSAAAVLDPRSGTQVRRHGGLLVLTQPDAEISVDELGTITVQQPAWTTGQQVAMHAVIQEDVVDRVRVALQFIAIALDHIDSVHRVSDLACVAALIGGGYGTWRTRAEQQASPNSMSVNMRAAERVVVSTPHPRLHRSALTAQIDQLAADLAALLRREATSRSW